MRFFSFSLRKFREKNYSTSVWNWVSQKRLRSRLRKYKIFMSLIWFVIFTCIIEMALKRNDGVEMKVWISINLNLWLARCSLRMLHLTRNQRTNLHWIFFVRILNLECFRRKYIYLEKDSFRLVYWRQLII